MPSVPAWGHLVGSWTGHDPPSQSLVVGAEAGAELNGDIGLGSSVQLVPTKVCPLKQQSPCPVAESKLYADVSAAQHLPSLK